MSNFFKRLKADDPDSEVAEKTETPAPTPPAPCDDDSDAGTNEKGTPAKKSKTRAKKNKKISKPSRRPAGVPTPAMPTASSPFGSAATRGRPSGITFATRLRLLGQALQVVIEAEALAKQLGTDEGMQSTSVKSFTAVRDKVYKQLDRKGLGTFDSLDVASPTSERPAVDDLNENYNPHEILNRLQRAREALHFAPPVVSAFAAGKGTHEYDPNVLYQALRDFPQGADYSPTLHVR